MCSGWLKDSVVEYIAYSGAASPQWMPRPFQFHSLTILAPYAYPLSHCIKLLCNFRGSVKVNHSTLVYNSVL